MMVYRAGSDDRVVPIGGFPSMDTGAPMPAIVYEGNDLVLSYHVAGDFDAPRAEATFRGVLACYLGWPNEEVIEAHPLYARGLMRFGAFEVIDSSWRQALMIANRAHPYHRDERFSEYRHIIVAFHDETFECLARTYEVVGD